MKGRREFTQREADRIRELLRKKKRVGSAGQKQFRDRLREIGSYISDFSYYGRPTDGFGVEDFDRLVEHGALQITSAGSSPEPRNNQQRRGRQSRDETYVIDLCDEILDESASRQHKFDLLRGDANTRLPVDAYYPSRKLVIEYRERQHTQPVAHFDKPRRMTVSGVHRGEQRRMYDERRREVLLKHGIRLVEIEYSSLEHRSNGRLIRIATADRAVIKAILRNALSEDSREGSDHSLAP